MEHSPPEWHKGDGHVLRYQIDAARNRLWALTAEGIELREATTRRKIAQIVLPDWVWAGPRYACAPDLAVGPRGEVVVSSNVISTLWRVDPFTLAVSKHDLSIEEDTGKDVGFSALAYSIQLGAYFAVSPSQGTLWRIDPLLRRAQNVPLSTPLPEACGLKIAPSEPDRRASEAGGFCVRREQGDMAISLAPDQRSGYVRPSQCVG